MFAVTSSALNGGQWQNASDRAQQYGAVVQKLGQVAQQAKAEPKALAAVKLQTALDQYRVLKLMGSGLPPAQQAEEAARIAKQIGDASQDYSNGVASSGNTAVTPASNYAVSKQAAPAPTPAPDQTQTPNSASPSPASAASTAATVSEATQLANDPGQFFALAFGVLKGLKKIMNQATQAMENDGDPDDKRKARKLKQRFDDAVASTTQAANRAGVALNGDAVSLNSGRDASDAAALAQTTTITLSVTTVDVQVGVNLTV
ncbi:MAG TPA: hypothetical protein VL574_09675 [Stellaceae bacterium]|nr:hypothetical protein [Stellaceae bacterium]